MTRPDLFDYLSLDHIIRHHYRLPTQTQHLQPCLVSRKASSCPTRGDGKTSARGTVTTSAPSHLGARCNTTALHHSPSNPVFTNTSGHRATILNVTHDALKQRRQTTTSSHYHKCTDPARTYVLVAPYLQHKQCPETKMIHGSQHMYEGS
jgi:hypothetical protein